MQHVFEKLVVVEALVLRTLAKAIEGIPSAACLRRVSSAVRSEAIEDRDSVRTKDRVHRLCR